MLNTLFDTAACGRLCVTLLHSLWQMALLACVAAAVSYFMGRNRVSARYWVHAAALFAGVLAMPLTHALVSYDAPPARAAAASPVTSAAADAAPRLQQVPPPLSARPTPASASPPVGSPTEVERTAPASRVRPEQVWRAAVPWLAGAHLLGVALMLARLTWAAVKLERKGARATTVVDGPIADAFRALCQRWSVRTVPTLAHAEQIAVPLVVGLLKPTILLPTTALTGLSFGDLEMILAHELAHVHRYDAWVNLVQRLAEALCFFNPAAWWLSRRISTLREYCCDEAACSAVAGADAETHLRYATALLRVVELSRGEASRQQLTAVAASGRTPSELRRRVARLFGEPLREPLRLSRGDAVALVFGTALALCVPPLAESETQVIPSKKSPPTEATEATKESAESPLATLAGRIVLEDGTPATVRGWLYSDASWSTPASADPNVKDLSTHRASSIEGDFIDKFECRVHAVTVSLFYFPEEGYAPIALGPFKLKPGDERRDLVLTLTPGDSTTLRVLNEQGEPVPRATVVKRPLLNGSTNGPGHEETTNSAGELMIERLTPGVPYAFRVFAPGFQPLRTKPLAINRAGMTLRLKRGRPATGIVRFPDGTPSPGTKLKALMKAFPGGGGALMDPRPETLATTDSDGRFSLNELADGLRYLMLIEAMDFNRVVVGDLEAGVENYQVDLPKRRDLVVRVRGDLGGLYKLKGKPYVWVQQRFEAKWDDTGHNSTLFSETVPIDPVEGGGQAIFRGLAIDLRPDAGEQEVEVGLGQDLATTKTAKITRSGPAALVEFDMRPAPSEAD